MTTIKSQFDQTLILFEDLCEALGRIDDRLQVMEKSSEASSLEGLSELSLETSDLRTALISLRQSLDNSIATDMSQFLSALKYLQSIGLPELLSQVKDLNIAVSALSLQLPNIEKAYTSLESVKQNSEDAGRFARHFHEPVRELLGRASDGSYQEGKFMLRNAIQILFRLTGRDSSGTPKDKTPDQIKVFLEHYFAQNYFDSEGCKRPFFDIILESGYKALRANLWQRIIKGLGILILYHYLVSPALQTTKALKDFVTIQNEIQASQAPLKTSPPRKD